MNNTDIGGIKELKTLHIALVIGLILIILAMYYLADKESLILAFSAGIPEIAVMFVVIMSLLMGPKMMQKRIGTMLSLDSAEEKWPEYRAIQIARYALVEGPGLICVCWFFVSQNLVFLYIAMALTFLLYTMKPSRERFFAEANIATEDQSKF